MFLPQFSLRTHVSALVISMGLLGLGLALLTGEYYRNLIYKHQRHSLARMAGVKADDTLREIEAKAREMAIALQHPPEFQRAYAARDKRTINALLEEQAISHFANPGLLRLESMHVLDKHLQTVARLEANLDSNSLCPGTVTRAAARSGMERLKPFTILCTEPGHLRLATLLPIGEADPLGYVAIVGDPSRALSAIGETLGLALRVRVGDAVLSSSPEWPDERRGDLLIAQTILPAEGTLPLILDIANHAEQLAAELHGARVLVMLLAGFATLMVTFIALVVFGRCTLQPLRHLTHRMRLVRNDRSFLGTQVEPTGSAEMRELAEDFNDLSAELRGLQETLESLAYNDHLTSLPNRILFRDRLEQQIRLSAREQAGFAVLAIDLDRFKQINDRLGHHIGDLLLQQVAQRMKRALRKSDTLAFSGNTVARVGGDEFSVLLPTADQSSEAATVAQKLIRILDEEFDLEGNQLKVGMSIGIAFFPQDARDMEGLIRAADRAMYEAKRRGGGFCIFGPAPFENEDGVLAR